jgi:hypothetical protein
VFVALALLATDAPDGSQAHGWRSVMRLLLVAAMIATLTLPALAQMGGVNGLGAGQGAGRAGAKASETPEEAAKKKEEDKARERAYSDAVKRIPAPAKKYDPWGTVRSSGDTH